MLKRLLFVLLFLLIFSPVQAVSWPPEVRPEQGKAVGTIGTGEDKLNISIDFWNVGMSGSDEYGKVTVVTKCIEGLTYHGYKCVADENPPAVGTFSGGPNGEITINGKTNIKLVDGKYFKSDLEKTFQATVENPEIFSKYRWSLNESVPAPKIEGGEYEVETYKNVRFNDMYGQVEVNIPKPDGTYDEEAWDFAKLEMELPPGTHIKVGEKSGLMLTFTNQTSIIVGPGTEIILVSGPEEPGMLKMLAGKLWVNFKKMTKGESLEIEMIQAVAGIKGTTFVLSDDGKQSTLKVIEGTVAYTSKTNGQTEAVLTGETITADKNGLGQKTTFDVGAEKAGWDSLSKGGNSAGQKNYLYYAISAAVLLSLTVIAVLAKKRQKNS